MIFPRVAVFAIALLTLTWLDGIGAAQAARIRAFKADAKEIAKTTGQRSYRLVVVVGDDSVDNAVDSVRVSLRPVGDAPPPVAPRVLLPLKVVKDNGNKRFVNTSLAFDGDAIGASYVLTATMLDVDGGAVGVTVTSTVQVEDALPTKLASVAIRSLDATSFKLRVVVSGDDDHEVHSADVRFVDITGTAPLPTELRLVDPTTDGDTRVFVMKTLTFEKPAAAVGAKYNLLIDLKDAAGKSLGDARTWTVVVNG